MTTTLPELTDTEQGAAPLPFRVRLYLVVGDAPNEAPH
ncbi:hypothetical protein MGSAQ_003086 [marine sediment metagenome]|uniref:Uncharacterized protein n=1 Tax=marine sediment metagenome TaxID=412755 RepID=A0A1B6NQ19_9ZZZZ